MISFLVGMDYYVFLYSPGKTNGTVELVVLTVIMFCIRGNMSIPKKILLDFDGRTHLETVGFGPFASKRHGNFSEIASVYISRDVSRASTYFTLGLTFGRPSSERTFFEFTRPRYSLLSAFDAYEIETYAVGLADKMDVPYERLRF
jgi:hypothetical protein